ncbi:hypothetical protein AXG93_421s1090 [Marchantia polymorpha subsp. ruderalis]|uniref:Protein kinase domain-containing protein n=1 Tax=Marchantia polymorpha subsp. ruderalis TaxID=1480154 RepID=A0A176VJD6_MARPO|nr:hypothetical protein AXG93_421s1090 [Marchantia polymorpha subsp. ruderalis]
MERGANLRLLLIACAACMLASGCFAARLLPLPSSQILGLLQLQNVLESPPALNGWNETADSRLSPSFSSSTLGDALMLLPNLTVLELVSLGIELNSLELRSFILSKNFFTGPLHGFNTTTFQNNEFSGPIPDLSRLQKLQSLNLNGNALGPDIPSLGSNLVVLQIARNELVGPIRDDLLGNYTHLRMLDLSFNSLTGFPPLSLFTLPNIETILLAENHLSGEFPIDMPMDPGLVYLDISSNFFTGALPTVLALATAKGDRYVDIQNNCFDVKVPKQQPQSFCLYESSMYSPRKHKNVALIAGLVGGGVGVVLSIIAVVFVYLCKRKKTQRSPHIGDYTASSNAGSSVAIPSELLSNARYLSQSMRLGVLSLPHNQVFSIEQLEEATDNFSDSALIGEGVRGKVYKGRLEDGTNVAVKCCCFDPKLDTHDVKAQMELLSKLRHHHVASVIGYCFVDGESGNRNDRRLLVVTEFVDNSNLRTHISGSEDTLSWLRRLAAVIGAAKGVHYLHHGVLPSIFHHDLRMSNILMDHNFVPKVADFGLPRPPPHVIAMQSAHVRRSHYRYRPDPYLTLPEPIVKSEAQGRRYAKEMDVYNFGLILLEIIMGRPPVIEKALGEKPKIVEMARFMDLNPSMDLIDPAIVGECGGESLATVVDIAMKCLADDMGARPSMEDVLWNLQYAVQVQDTSYADASDDMFDYCSSPGSVRMRKDRSMMKSGSFEQKISFSGEHERKLSVDDMTHSPRYITEFLR